MMIDELKKLGYTLNSDSSLAPPTDTVWVLKDKALTNWNPPDGGMLYLIDDCLMLIRYQNAGESSGLTVFHSVITKFTSVMDYINWLIKQNHGGAR